MNPQVKTSSLSLDDRSQPAGPVKRKSSPANGVTTIRGVVIRLLAEKDYRGINKVFSQIERRDTELRLAKDELEARVAERTRDLRDEIFERRRVESDLKQQIARISLLNTITRAIATRQDTESILHVVLRHLEEHMGLDLGVMMLFDARAQVLNVTALRVKNPALAGRLNLQPGVSLPVAQTGFQLCEKGQMVYCDDTYKESAPFMGRLAVAGWRSMAAVPLMVDEKLFGVLFSARVKPEGFSSGDCEFLRMLSEHVALAAHQSRLYKDLAKAYQELRQSQAAVLRQERLKALGQMASGIAHDVNNALSPIVGCTELIEKLEAHLCPDSKRCLRNIRTAGGDIAHIVARLREFYCPRAGGEALQELDLNALLEQVVDMMRHRWRDIPQSNGVTIEVGTQLAPNVPRLAGMVSEVREAFTNLVLNAVDAMPGGGKITLRTSVTCPERNGSRPQASQVIVEISDTGMGMSEETRKRCLEPFFSTKGKRGTGLGLAMVYGVMERHEGSLEIHSEPGKGTAFRLIFPVRDHLCAGEEPAETMAPTEPLRILCIDDEPLLRELLKELLRGEGHDVEVSDSGQSGLDEFRISRERGRPYDVVITDLGMPDLDGRQVTRIIKKESPETPVIVLTGWGGLTNEPGEAPLPVDGILGKPPHSRELRETLSRFHPGQNGVVRETWV